MYKRQVIYEGKTFPVGTLACDALNVPADTITKMNEQCEKINLLLGILNAGQDASALLSLIHNYVQKHYINCILPRVHCSVYSFSHVLMTAFGGFLAVFLGYSLCFGLMALRLPHITSDEVKASTETMSLMGYDSLLLHAPMLYFCLLYTSISQTSPA